jgi:hypothetical protein
VRAEVRRTAPGEYEVRIVEQDDSDRAIVQRFTTTSEPVGTIRAAAQRVGWKNLRLPIAVDPSISSELQEALDELARERKIHSGAPRHECARCASPASGRPDLCWACHATLCPECHDRSGVCAEARCVELQAELSRALDVGAGGRFGHGRSDRGAVRKEANPLTGEGTPMITFDNDVPDELRHRARTAVDAEPSLFDTGVFIRLGLAQDRTGFGRWTIRDAFSHQTDLKMNVREALQRAGEPLAP